MAAKKSKKVKLNKSKITLRVGETIKLKLKNSKKKVTWSSSEKKIAKVDKKGKVTAVKKGKAKITTMQNKKVDASYNMKGKGYSTIKAVTGLPAGVTYKLGITGYDIIFNGKATETGTFTGTIVTEDELGNIYTVKTIWLVGSEKHIAAAYAPKYGIVGESSYSFYNTISICGGSGNYIYEIADDKKDYTVTGDGLVNGIIYEAGTYQIKVKITDAEDASITTTAICDISCAKGKTIAGIIKDGLGNAIQGQSIRVSFYNKDKANLYSVSVNAYSEETGAYSAALVEGTYEAYARYNDARSSMIKCQMNTDKSGVDFILPIYPVTFTCDNDNFDLLSGYWEDEDGSEYYLNGKKMYLKEGTHTLTNTYNNGFIKFEASVTVTVTASANNTAEVIVVEENRLEEKLGGTIKAGDSLSVEVTGSDYIYYAFVPEKTDEYTFYSTADGEVYYDTCGTLLDEKGNQLRYNDDGGENENFSFTYACQKDVKYYIGIKAYSGNGIIPVKLCVEENVPVNDEE